MFGTFRRHQKWLFGIIIAVVIVSFVVYFQPSGRNRSSGASMAKAPVINGKTITPRIFADAAREVELLYFLNFRKWPDQDSERAREIGFDKENEAYLRLFRVAKAEEAGIHVADKTVAELAHRLLGDYPLDKFEKEVLKPVGLKADDFERFVRNDAAIQQLSTVVGAAGRLITPAEAEALYRREHQEIAGEIVHFPISNYMTRVTITNGALTNFFFQQMSRYRVPEKVRVSYVEFAKSNFLAEADKQFGTLTNLDFQLRELYFKQGTNSFKDTNGVMLSEKAALEKIKEDQRNRLALSFAARKANEFANKVYDKQPAQAENLDKVAADENLKLQVSQPFDMEEGPTNLDVSPRFTRIAFSLNATNNPVSFEPVEGEHGIYVIALKETIPGRPQPFEEVREKVAEDYRRYNAFTLARSDATNFVGQATNALARGKTFDEVAQELKLKAESLPPISQATDSLTNLAQQINPRQLQQLKSILFGLEPGKVSGYVANPPEGGYVVYVRARLPFDDDKVRTELPKFLSELRYQKQNEIFGQWFRKQVEKADLPLNRPKQRPGASPGV